MNMRSVTERRLLYVILAVLIFFQGWNIVVAQSAQISMCADKDGDVYLIGPKFDNKKCKKGDSLLTWNTVGPQGIQGPKGDKGDQGIQGIAGLKGADGKDGVNGKDGENGKDGTNGVSIPCLTVSGTDVIFEGCNLIVRSGSGSTNGTTNGLGNIIIGYNENDGSDAKTGSHNLVIGPNHTYTNYGGIVSGSDNRIAGPYSSVTGGSKNAALTEGSSVSGGYDNWSARACVGAPWMRCEKDADCNSGDTCGAGAFSSISGGTRGISSALYSSVSGGYRNIAGGENASASGGEFSWAMGKFSSVLGGSGVAHGDYAVIVGGNGNDIGPESSYGVIVGGFSNFLGGDSAVLVGGEDNVANGEFSVLGGGKDRMVTGAHDWMAGSLFEDF